MWYHYPRRYQGKSPKWQKNYIGPYLVVRVIEPSNYVLQKSSRAKPFVVHVDKIKICHNPLTPNWLADGTGQEDQSGHEDGRLRRTLLQYDALPPQTTTQWRVVMLHSPQRTSLMLSLRRLQSRLTTVVGPPEEDVTHRSALKTSWVNSNGNVRVIAVRV